MIQEWYRRDYTGEFVVVETKIIDGVKQEQREWIDNPVTNEHISGRAAVIGSRVNQHRFQHQRLQNHRGGLLGKKKLQTYGSDDIWRDMRLDFYVGTKKTELADIVSKNYIANTVVYSNANRCVENPGCFYIVPYLPYLSDPAAAVYLAAFDGHEEIFLLGHNTDVVWEDKNTVSEIASVISTYQGTRFISVSPPASQPDSWLDQPNFSTMALRDWISYCDV